MHPGGPSCGDTAKSAALLVQLRHPGCRKIYRADPRNLRRRHRRRLYNRPAPGHVADATFCRVCPQRPGHPLHQMDRGRQLIPCNDHLPARPRPLPGEQNSLSGSATFRGYGRRLAQQSSCSELLYVRSWDLFSGRIGNFKGGPTSANRAPEGNAGRCLRRLRGGDPGRHLGLHGGNSNGSAAQTTERS